MNQLIDHINSYPSEWKKRARITYLKISIVALKDKRDTMVQLAKWMMIDRRNISSIMYLRKVEEIDQKLRSMEAELKAISVSAHGQITPEMKMVAKQVPFEEIHEFNRGQCICPFHEDNKPSMSLMPSNRVYCHSCGKSWDTIQFLIERDGIGFHEATTRLVDICRQTSQSVDKVKNFVDTSADNKEVK